MPANCQVADLRSCVNVGHLSVVMGAWPPVSNLVLRDIILACQTCLTDVEAASTCCHFQMSSTVSNGLGFASYETGLSMYRKMYEGVTPGPAERGVIAGGAAVTVMAAIQPLEVCCRRMQASSLDISPSLPGIDKLGSRVISLHEACLTVMAAIQLLELCCLRTLKFHYPFHIL